jgi:hypothetical protein
VRERERDKKEKEQTSMRRLCEARRRAGEDNTTVTAKCMIREEHNKSRYRYMNGWVAERISFNSTTEKGKSLVVDFDWIWTQREDVKVREKKREEEEKSIQFPVMDSLFLSFAFSLTHTDTHGKPLSQQHLLPFSQPQPCHAMSSAWVP